MSGTASRIETEELLDAAFDCREAGIPLEEALQMVQDAYKLEVSNEPIP